MKVAFTGASGSGKTTLVHYVEKFHGLPWINGSSGEIKTLADNAKLQSEGLVIGKGHREVIQSGHANPEAAINNQWAILRRRSDIIHNTPNFITDRSPIDNWVYYLLQCSMYQTEDESVRFLEQCKEAIKGLTHVIYIPTMFQPEDNGSRIPNFWFQMMVSTVFKNAFDLFQNYADIEGWEVKFLCLHMKNLELRKQAVTEFLNG
jgi:ABC-type dipeptide/oligopeptide/nickel transport system ATPase subunit